MIRIRSNHRKIMTVHWIVHGVSIGRQVGRTRYRHRRSIIET